MGGAGELSLLSCGGDSAVQEMGFYVCQWCLFFFNVFQYCEQGKAEEFYMDTMYLGCRRRLANWRSGRVKVGWGVCKS